MQKTIFIKILGTFFENVEHHCIIFYYQHEKIKVYVKLKITLRALIFSLASSILVFSLISSFILFNFSCSS